MNRIVPKQAGLTLIELMISVALGIFVLIGLVYVTSSTMRTNTQTLRSTHLNQDLRAAMHLISRDLRRAGGISRAAEAIKFSMTHGLDLNGKISGADITITASDSALFDSWVDTGVLIKSTRKELQADGNYLVINSCIQITSRSNNTTLVGDNVACPGEGSANSFASDGVAANSWIFTNTFSTASYILTNDPSATVYNCIIFGYDKDKDNVADASETLGFRWDPIDPTPNDDIGRAIEAGNSNTLTCTSVPWENLTDDRTIDITGFTITRLTPLTSSIPEFKISIEGELLSDRSVKRKIEDVVRVRNDAFL